MNNNTYPNTKLPITSIMLYVYDGQAFGIIPAHVVCFEYCKSSDGNYDWTRVFLTGEYTVIVRQKFEDFAAELNKKLP